MIRVMPSVSVVVPTHGRASLLANALTSIAEQTHLPVSVIVVDDLGDPSTRNLTEARVATFPTQLDYIHNDGQSGACGSRNLGARVSVGEAIAFLDDDDRWDPLFLWRCMDALASSSIDFVLTDINRCFPDGTTKRLTTPSKLTSSNVLYQRVHMTGSSFVIRRAAFEDVSGFDPDVPVFNDWDLFLRLVRSGKTYEAIPEALVQWIEHDGARITTATLRRADGIDRFLAVYGPDMRYDVRAYFLRIAYGIRKAHEQSAIRRTALTAEMLYKAGARGASAILFQGLAERLG